MSSSHKLLRIFRLVHLYIGVFTAPALLFFAFTGALQTFSLHEATRGSSYKPPAWAVTLAQLHKKQTTVVPQRRLPPDAGRPGAGAPPSSASPSGAPEPKSETHPGAESHHTDHQAAAPASAATGQPAPESRPEGKPATPESAQPAPKPHNTLPLKIFFLIVAVGLFLSTLTGIYMSYRYLHNRAVVTALLVAGVVVPIVLGIL
jgi:PepSY-associated TM region